VVDLSQAGWSESTHPNGFRSWGLPTLNLLQLNFSNQSSTMAVLVLIPTPLQKFTADEASAEVEASSVDGLLQALEARYPGILGRLCDESGKLRRFLNVYVNSEDIRFLQNQETPLTDGDEVSIVPAVAGG
jgi:molybdopterin converting factor small subunit